MVLLWWLGMMPVSPETTPQRGTGYPQKYDVSACNTKPCRISWEPCRTRREQSRGVDSSCQPFLPLVPLFRHTFVGDGR